MAVEDEGSRSCLVYERSYQQVDLLSIQTKDTFDKVFKVSPVNHLEERMQGLSSSRGQTKDGLRLIF